MPDLVSHILVCLVACELVNFKKKGLILFGAILPDLISKISLVGLYFKIPLEIIRTFNLFHNPVPLFFLVVLVALFFKNFFSAAYLLGVGGVSHIILDSLNAHFFYGIRWLFPFSWKYYRIDLFWPDQYLLVLIPLLIMYLFVKVHKSLK